MKEEALKIKKAKSIMADTFPWKHSTNAVVFNLHQIKRQAFFVRL